MLIGYARISKADGSQSLDLQRDALAVAGVQLDRIYEYQASGVRDDRPGLDACLPSLQNSASSPSRSIVTSMQTETCESMENASSLLSVGFCTLRHQTPKTTNGPHIETPQTRIPRREPKANDER